jgi:hypothetical protein
MNWTKNSIQKAGWMKIFWSTVFQSGKSVTLYVKTETKYVLYGKEGILSKKGNVMWPSVLFPF